MTDHTPEPWVPAKPNEPWVLLSLPDYERARACVNACAGIPTEQIGSVKALVKSARRVWDEIEETEYGCPTDVSDEAAGELAAALNPFPED